ncbi:3-isopropylmalate dehydratase [Aspergillus luchuensis]|uniref:3-isopropylmalate dehydratase n=1 Tax=Aspergillus kawachii TaxID=1069201 RepID=A0A146FDY5_ASPKA|nr:3-isopropylmalate dehydratase [Aspergillus luchuensis]
MIKVLVEKHGDIGVVNIIHDGSITLSSDDQPRHADMAQQGEGLEGLTQIGREVARKLLKVISVPHQMNVMVQSETPSQGEQPINN